MSGAVTAYNSMTSSGKDVDVGETCDGLTDGHLGYTFMLPQGIGPDPNGDVFNFFPQTPFLEAGIETAIAADGSVSTTLVPAFGFNLQLDFGGQRLVDTDIRFDFTSTLVTELEASTSGDCDGAKIGVTWHNQVDFSITNPISLWDGQFLQP